MICHINFKCGNIKQPAIKYQHMVIAAHKASGHSIQQLQNCRKCRGQILFSYKIASGTDFTKDVFLGIFWNFLEKLFLRTPPNRSSHWRCSIKKAAPKNFIIFTGKHLCWSLFLIKLQACNIIKKRLQPWCFPVNNAKFLRTPILKSNSKWLLLSRRLLLQSS